MFTFYISVYNSRVRRFYVLMSFGNDWFDDYVWCLLIKHWVINDMCCWTLVLVRVLKNMCVVHCQHHNTIFLCCFFLIRTFKYVLERVMDYMLWHILCGYWSYKTSTLVSVVIGLCGSLFCVSVGFPFHYKETMEMISVGLLGN